MRAILYVIAAGLALTATSPLDAHAQARRGDRVGDHIRDRTTATRTHGSDAQRRGGHDRHRERDHRIDERHRQRDHRVDERRRQGERDRFGDRVVQQQGPPFCRNGRGHPVHGMRWCHERGFATGRVLRWDRAPWEDVILRNPRRAERTHVGRAVLSGILGGGVYGRVDAHRRSLGLTDALVGRWERDTAGVGVLRLFAGGVPVAEFIDRTGNGRADIVRINTGR
jgi:hypothetical protein